MLKIRIGLHNRATRTTAPKFPGPLRVMLEIQLEAEWLETEDRITCLCCCHTRLSGPRHSKHWRRRSDRCRGSWHAPSRRALHHCGCVRWAVSSATHRNRHARHRAPRTSSSPARSPGAPRRACLSSIVTPPFVGPNHARQVGATRALVCNQPILILKRWDPGHLPQRVLAPRARKATLSTRSVRHLPNPCAQRAVTRHAPREFNFSPYAWQRSPGRLATTPPRTERL